MVALWLGETGRQLSLPLDLMDKGIIFNGCQHARAHDHDAAKSKSTSVDSVVMAQTWDGGRLESKALQTFTAFVCAQFLTDSLECRIWQSRTLSPKLSTSRGAHTFQVLLLCVGTVWMNHFIPTKIKGKGDWVKMALGMIWCHQGHAVHDSDLCMIHISDAIRLHIPGPSGALSVWGYRTGSDFSGNPPAKNL